MPTRSRPRTPTRCSTRRRWPCPATVVTSTIQTLQRFEEFFRRQASAAVHTELRAFCTAQGWHGVSGAQAVLDDLGWNAASLRRALQADHTPHPGQDRR